MGFVVVLVVLFLLGFFFFFKEFSSQCFRGKVLSDKHAPITKYAINY